MANDKRKEIIGKVIDSLRGLDTVDPRTVRNRLMAIVQDGTQVQKTYLQTFQKIENTVPVYKFDFGQGKSERITAPTRKLRENELFVVTSMKMYLLRVTNAGGAPDGTERPQTHVSSVVFPVAAGFTPEHLNQFFHAGSLLWKENNTTINWADFPTNDFEVIPEFQKTGSTNESQYHHSMGQVVPPSISVLDGDNTHIFALEVSAPYGGTQWASATAGVVHYVALRYDGLLLPITAFK